jgi:hypothetical protein
MAIANLADLMWSFLKATTPSSVRDILQDIGDYADVGLDDPFGPLKLMWHPFGDNPSNFSTVNLGSKAGRSLTERITNAQDALIEDRAATASGVALLSSPREAAKQWFGRPITGPDEGLFKWKFSKHQIDRRIGVVMHAGDTFSSPTLDVLDSGIGIQSQDFRNTILSLQKGNKINKRYLMGAFGQGGAATLGFSEYALILSRHKGNPHEVGFTLIRILNLSDAYKEDCYCYLVIRNQDGNINVPSCRVGDDPVMLYPEPQRVPPFSQGTLVRHYGYKLSGLEKTLSPAPGNLYSFLHCSMFDPLFPFRIIDLRDPDPDRPPKDELVTGSRNRLMRHTQTREEEEGGRTEIRHYRPMEYVVPQGTSDPSIGVEYWVVYNYKKSGKNEWQLRASSNELFVQQGYPIVGTLNGQNQGELPASILREVGLGMVARHIVVHIDTSEVNSKVRRELFTSTREGFKDGDALTGLVNMLRKMLEEDEHLHAIERELTERLAKRDVAETKEEVKRQVTRLLLEAGLQPRQEGPTNKEGEGEPAAVQRPRRAPYKNFDPIPTLPFPQVTKLIIIVPRPKMEVRINDNETLLVETDADSEYYRSKRIAIRTEPSVLEPAFQAPLRGGRIRWRLRPGATAKEGDKGKIIVTLTKPDGTQLIDSVDFEVLPALEEKAKKAPGFIPDFAIYAINPHDNAELWGDMWPHLADETDPNRLASVAYRQLKASGKIMVYYSTVFAPFAEQINKLKSQSSTLIELFRTNYEVWIAYHAILQEMKPSAITVTTSEDVIDTLREEERCRVAQLEVKQAIQFAQLKYRTLRE